VQKKKLKWVIVISGILLIFFAVAAVEVTSQPRFCYSCHEMGPLYEAWQDSFHKDIACLKCHAEPGVSGLIRTKAKGLRELYVHFTNPQVEPREDADTWGFSLRCLECHDEVKEKGGPHNKKHFEMKFVCVKCHEGIGHDAELSNKLPSREICAQCHD